MPQMLLAAVLLAVASCGREDAPPADDSPVANLVLTNGNIVTIDEVRNRTKTCASGWPNTAWSAS